MKKHTDGYKVKYFKDSIIGMKAKLTYSHSGKEMIDKFGIIRKGEGVNRFSIEFPKPVNKIITIQLSEEDEILLIPN
jgi:hypothetical protein